MSIDVNVRITEDRKKATVTFNPQSEDEKVIELDQSEVVGLLQVLGTVNWAMLEGKPVPEITGAKLKPVYQTKWAVQKDLDTKGTLLAFQHPGYGPLGFVLSENQIKDYARALQKCVKAKRPTSN